MKNLLISIKPKYVSEIMNGNKKFEYRKKIFKKDIDKIYIYSSAPKKEIIGYFIYSGFISGNPETVWSLTSEFSGIKKEDYFKYFDNRINAYALKIENLKIYENPINPYLKNKNFRPPQSFMYIEGLLL